MFSLPGFSVSQRRTFCSRRRYSSGRRQPRKTPPARCPGDDCAHRRNRV